MKTTFFYLLISIGFSITGIAQTTPYTGGSGSGFSYNNTPEILCPMFFGGIGDGFGNDTSTTIICPSFLGGTGDGFACDNSMAIICPSFFGGTGDGLGINMSNCSVILPYSKLDFYGQGEAQRNLLFWKITNPLDILRFEIEKSNDGIVFIKVGTVSSTFTSSYNFIDNFVSGNTSYYRLRVIEKNNSFSFSNIVVLKNFLKNALTLYPNPTSTFSTLSYYSETNQMTSLRLLTIDGKNIFIRSVMINKGQNIISIDFRDVPTGVYLLHIGVNLGYVKVLVVRK
jgi:hypothetical protein